MKIGLVSALMVDNNIQHQLNQIEFYVKNNSQCDLLCFGESFLQGFEGLTWNYEEDLKRAISIDSSTIDYIKNIASKYKTAISFGFIEEYQKKLFSSNLVINSAGKIIDVFRRVSIGWKEHRANKELYREGNNFHTFSYMEITFATAICGDLWHDNFLEEMIKSKTDIVLWPLYIDYSIDDWNKNEKIAYCDRVSKINAPVLMINSFVNDPSRAKGGCYVFFQNKILSSLELGNMGVLEYSHKQHN